MKIFYTILLLSLGSTVLAQSVNLNVYTGYVFDDKFDTYYTAGSYQGKFLGGFQWGGGLEFQPREDMGIELLYIRQDTQAPTTTYLGSIGDNTYNFDVDINYVLLGGIRYFGPSPKVQGYGGLMLGGVFAGVRDPDSGRDGNVSKFAWGAKLGANIWGSERVGLKIQAQILSATQMMGGGIYFGTGGAGAGVSSYSTIYQFTLGGGLVFKVK